jgi:hypothetical protein
VVEVDRIVDQGTEGGHTSDGESGGDIEVEGEGSAGGLTGEVGCRSSQRLSGIGRCTSLV